MNKSSTAYVVLLFLIQFKHTSIREEIQPFFNYL